MGTVRAGIYVRISMDRTGKEAGVQRQEKSCRGLAASKGWEVAGVFSDNDVSAYNGRRRPEYERMLRAIQDGQIDVVIAWHPDRLYRRIADLEHLISLAEEHSVQFATVSAGEVDLATATGRAAARITGTMARYESEHKAERLRSWHEERAAKGLPHGGGRRPFGYDFSSERGTWMIREEEAKVIRRVAKGLLRGRSLSGLVNELNSTNVPTATGSRWSTGTLSRLVLNPTVAGLRVHRRMGVTTKGNWEAIITPRQHELLERLFNDPARPKRGGGPTTRSRLLSGLIVCAHCRQKVYGDGPSAYACSRSWKGCGGIRINAAPLEDFVIEEAVAHMNFLSRFRESVNDATDSAMEEEALIDERLRLRERRDSWAEKLAEGVVDDRAYTVGVRKLDGRIHAIEEQLAQDLRQHQSTVNWKEAFQHAEGFDRRRRSGELSSAELMHEYEWLASMIERIEVRKASRRGARWEPERVQIVWRGSKHQQLRGKKAS